VGSKPPGRGPGNRLIIIRRSTGVNALRGRSLSGDPGELWPTVSYRSGTLEQAMIGPQPPRFMPRSSLSEWVLVLLEGPQIAQVHSRHD
jgi:hypothetical protein